MIDLLPKDILKDVLETTGAYKDIAISRVLKGDFKSFNFQIKKKEEFDLNQCEKGFNDIRQGIEADWQLHYFEGCIIKRNQEKLINLLKYPQRATSICVALKTNLFKDSFLVYFGLDSFFCLLNDFLGGVETSGDKSAEDLTEVETVLFDQIMTRICTIISDSFNHLEKLDLKISSLNLDTDQQGKEFTDRHLVSEYYFLKDDRDYKITLAVPMVFLDHLQEKFTKQSQSIQIKKDPRWQSAVTNAFFRTQLDLKVSLGSLEISFKDFLNLKSGDAFMWDKQRPDVTVLQDEVPRIKGTLGIVNGNFAVKVDELFES